MTRDEYCLPNRLTSVTFNDQPAFHSPRRVPVRTRSTIVALVAAQILAPSVASASWMWANRTTAQYTGGQLDHTYACVSPPYGATRCFAVIWNGSMTTTTGGTLVSGTNGVRGKFACYASCAFTYGWTGVCHQHTNRVLYDGNISLNSNVRGYATSVWTYGALGRNFSSCTSSCTSSSW